MPCACRANVSWDGAKAWEHTRSIGYFGCINVLKRLLLNRPPRQSDTRLCGFGLEIDAVDPGTSPDANRVMAKRRERAVG
jgi:hypothetical protein